MTEDDYFSSLELRITSELAGMRQAELRGWWCDGFIPDVFEVVGERCRFRGRVWMALHQKLWQEWEFVVYLGPAQLREAIDWKAAYPAADVTGWLSLDFATKFMKVNPFAARPDLEPAPS